MSDPGAPLFRNVRQFAAALILGFLLCWATVALMRNHANIWWYRLDAKQTWQIDQDRNPYEALWNWKGIYTGDYQPIFEAAQGFAQDPAFRMYQPDQLKANRASFVYTPITALACRPVSAPGMTLQQSADIVSIVNHLMWIAAGAMLWMIIAWRRPHSWPLLGAFAAAYLAYFPYAQALQLTQASIWIYFFLAAAAFLFQRGWITCAGVALAFGVAIKPHLVAAPLVLFFVPGFPRRMLWVCFATIAACAGISFLYAGWDNCWDYATKTLPTLSAGYAYYPNQTLNGMLLRVFEDYDPADFNLARPHAWIKALSTLFFVAVPVAMWRVCRSRPAAPAPADNLLALALVLAAGVLASPVAWLHHFTALGVSFAVAISYLRHHPERRASGIEAALFASYILTGWFFDTRELKAMPEALVSGWGFLGVIVHVGALAALVARPGAAPFDAAALASRARERLRALPAAPWFAAAAVVAAVCADLAIYGHEIGQDNHVLQIPYLKRLLDPTLYPNDAFMDSMRGYFSWFWVLFAPLLRVFPMEPLFLACHIATLALSYSAIWALARTVWPAARWAAALALFIFLNLQTDFGREALHWFYFAHTTLATALGFWALVLAARGAWLPAFALAGLIFNIQSMQSAYLLMMLALPCYLEERGRFLRPALGIAAWAALAAPGIGWLVSGGGLGAPDNLGRILRTFFPGHFFASSWRWWQWTGFLLCIASFAALAIAIPKPAGSPARRLAGVGASILIFWAIAGPLSEVAEPAVFLKLHIYRASSYFVLITVVLAAGWFADRFLPRLAESRRIPAALIAILAIAAIGPCGYMPWDRAMGQLLLLWTGALAVLALVLPGGARRVAAGGAVLFLALFGMQGAYLRERFHGWRDGYFDIWREAQLWAKDNTPPGTVFLTSPHQTGWRVHSERSTAGEWIEGAAAMWDPAYAERWSRWYVAMQGRWRRDYEQEIWDRLGNRWRDRPRAEIEAVARRFGARYIVTFLPAGHEENPSLKGNWAGDPQPVFQNRHFAIFPVPPAAP